MYSVLILSIRSKANGLEHFLKRESASTQQALLSGSFCLEFTSLYLLLMR